MIFPVTIELLKATQKIDKTWIIKCRLTHFRPWPWKDLIQMHAFIGYPGHWRYLSDFHEPIFLMDHLDAVFLKWEYDQKKLKEKLKE